MVILAGILAGIGGALGYIFAHGGLQVLEASALYIFLFYTDLGNFILITVMGVGAILMQVFVVWFYYQMYKVVKATIYPFVKEKFLEELFQ